MLALTHWLEAHGLREARSESLAGRAVPGTWGPHIAFGRATGIGWLPELRQIKSPCFTLLQPVQPQAPVFQVSMLAVAIPYRMARVAQVSPAWRAYAWQMPSGVAFSAASRLWSDFDRRVSLPLSSRATALEIKSRVRKLDKWMSFIASMMPLNKIFHLRIISDLYKTYNKPRILYSARDQCREMSMPVRYEWQAGDIWDVNANFSTKIIVHLQTPAKSPPRANKR